MLAFGQAKSSDFTDYRPAVNSTGDVVVLERTPVGGGGGPTTLYQIADFSAPNPVPFLSGQNAPPQSQTRPDWCWTTDQVAFNGADSNTSAPTVWQVGSDGVDCQKVRNTERFYYPTWSLDGSLLVTENGRTRAQTPPPPRNSTFDLAGELKHINIDALTPRGQRSLAACRPWAK